MTENRAVELLEYIRETGNGEAPYVGCAQNIAIDMAIKALEEIQQYRAIGTVEDLKSMKENGAFSGVELAQIACMQIKLKEYEAIGTIEEFKDLKVTQKMIEKSNFCLEQYRADTDTAYQCGYNKAIDEFVDRLEKYEQENWVNHLEYGINWSDIEHIVQEMKGSGKNE